MTEVAATSEAITEVKPEGQPVEAVAAKEDDKFSPKFAALVKKEKEAVKALRFAKEREAVIAKREAEIAAREKAIQELDELYSKNPLEGLKRKGYSYQDLTNMVLNDGKDTPELEVRKVNQRVEDFIKQQEEQSKLREQQELDQAKAEQARVIDDFKTEINDFIGEKAEEYELITLYGQSEQVFATIDAHFQKTSAEGKPKVMSIKEAADLTEKYLEKLVEDALKTKKLGAKLKPAEDKKDGPKEPSKTLSNAVTSSSAPSMLPAKTENDRIKRALAVLDKGA